jgi:hypothetical protein
MLVLVGPLLVLRLVLGAGFRLLVLLLLPFDFSVHTWNTSFTLIDIMPGAIGTSFFICQIDFFYLAKIDATARMESPIPHRLGEV